MGFYPDTLQNGETSTILIYDVISPSVRNPEQRENIMNIDNVLIYRLNDSSRINTDIKLTKNWEYTETGKHSANLNFVINEDDF